MRKCLCWACVEVDVGSLYFNITRLCTLSLSISLYADGPVSCTEMSNWTTIRHTSLLDSLSQTILDGWWPCIARTPRLGDIFVLLLQMYLWMYITDPLTIVDVTIFRSSLSVRLYNPIQKRAKTGIAWIPANDGLQKHVAWSDAYVKVYLAILKRIISVEFYNLLCAEFQSPISQLVDEKTTTCFNVKNWKTHWTKDRFRPLWMFLAYRVLYCE